MAMIGLGTTLSGSLSGLLGKIIDFDTAMSAEVDVEDSTTMDSIEGWKEKIPALKDAGRQSFTIEYSGASGNKAATIHSNLAVVQTWTITFPDTAIWVSSGFIQSHTMPAAHGSKMQQTVVIEFSGKPTFTPAS